ncbi:hypothetical protein GP2143_18091 [marine gamma proteobacterium HTCC2143]|uniref:Uncharacterized protein n=1 Tax=marine gamma proteobacterium HTCC2143 TaxID=247633 RepID=A0YAN8_9GAMM|nr:hypothetical protein GP2143_18091 [marine gamma proteobacterium HTCC2143]
MGSGFFRTYDDDGCRYIVLSVGQSGLGQSSLLSHLLPLLLSFPQLIDGSGSRVIKIRVGVVFSA